MIMVILSAVILTVLDQISKYFALEHLKPVGSVEFIKGVMNLTFVENRGAAFGILEGARWFFIIMTLIVTVAVLVYIKKYMPAAKEYKFVKLSLTLVLAGAWGNVIDRALRGYVVDYFETTFIPWPVFNVADIYIVCGTILLIFLFLFVIKEDEKDKKDK